MTPQNRYNFACEAYQVLLIWDSRPWKSYCLEQINFTSSVEPSPDFLNAQLAIQGESTFPNKCTLIWQSNNGFSGLSLQRNLNESTSFVSTKTWWDIFSISTIIPYFPFLNFIMTDTKLFKKSIPPKRLSFKHALLILAETSKTTRTRSGLLIRHDGVCN